MDSEVFSEPLKGPEMSERPKNLPPVEDTLLGSNTADAAAISPKTIEKPHALTFRSPDSTGVGDESESPHLIHSYDQIPVLEQTKLPRGGVSVETKAVGRVQVCFVKSHQFCNQYRIQVHFLAHNMLFYSFFLYCSLAFRLKLSKIV